MLKVLAKEKVISGKVVIEIDCTNLGSGLANFAKIDASTIVAKYFAALLNQIGTALLDNVINMEAATSEVQERIFGKLAGLANCFESPQPGALPMFNYRQIYDSLTQILRDLSIPELYILIDEWAQVPIGVQPLLAELIKRALFSIPNISLKIMAVNYQCNFSERCGGDIIGLQPGADITDIIDIDSYFVYDENPELVKRIFSQILYNHLGAELHWDLSLSDSDKYLEILKLFTQEPTFHELVRASEGNPRDFLCVFAGAYYDGFLFSDKSNSISIPNIEKAAYQWFEKGKMINIKTEFKVTKMLQHIFEQVIKGYKSRTFMVAETQASHPMLLRLLNERILHKLNITYSHRHEPGKRYNLYTLDFGAYIRFKGTENQPGEQIFFDAQDIVLSPEYAERSLVPIDDRRSIRNIVLDLDDFS